MDDEDGARGRVSSILNARSGAYVRSRYNELIDPVRENKLDNDKAFFSPFPSPNKIETVQDRPTLLGLISKM